MMLRNRSLWRGLALTMLAGCAPTPEPEAEPQPAQETAATPEAAAPETWCRVCEVDRGEKLPEYLPSRLDVTVDGQAYHFCADACRAKFDADPKRYTNVTEAPQPAPDTVDEAGGGG